MSVDLTLIVDRPARKLCDWESWLTAWQQTDLVACQLGLLHDGLKVSRNPTLPLNGEEKEFYIRVADTHSGNANEVSHKAGKMIFKQLTLEDLFYFPGVQAAFFDFLQTYPGPHHGSLQFYNKEYFRDDWVLSGPLREKLIELTIDFATAYFTQTVRVETMFKELWRNVRKFYQYIPPPDPGELIKRKLQCLEILFALGEHQGLQRLLQVVRNLDSRVNPDVGATGKMTSQRISELKRNWDMFDGPVLQKLKELALSSRRMHLSEAVVRGVPAALVLQEVLTVQEALLKLECEPV